MACWAYHSNSIDMATVLQTIRSAGNHTAPYFISTVNLNYLVTSRADSEFKDALLLSDLCTADGMPIVWIPRLLGIPIKERIAGSDIIDALKTPRSSSSRLKVFVFGGPKGVADAACKNINAASNSMTCVGSFYPGYSTVDELCADPVIDRVNSSDADMLVACLGTKKGQVWLHRNHDRLQIPVRVHVGAAVKYEAGTIKRAPVFMQKCGLEWLWRIKEEPALWRRYWADGIWLLRLLLTQIVPLFIVTRWHRLLRGRKAQYLRIALSEDDKSVTIGLSGAATAQHVEKATPYFRDALITEKPVVINFSDTHHIDARFIGLLLMLNKQLAKRQIQLTFARVPRHIERIFRLSGFAFLLPQ